jgi:hypothetical protein
VLEIALERPAVGHFLAASDPRLQHPRQHEPFGRATFEHTRDVAGPEHGKVRNLEPE